MERRCSKESNNLILAVPVPNVLFFSPGYRMNVIAAISTMISITEQLTSLQTDTIQFIRKFNVRNDETDLYKIRYCDSTEQVA
jgi:hypothetical protein